MVDMVGKDRAQPTELVGLKVQEEENQMLQNHQQVELVAEDQTVEVQEEEGR